MLDRESPASQNEESSKAMRPTPTTLCSTAKRISALITLSIQEHFALLNLQKKSAAPGALPPSAFRTASSKLNELRSVPRRRWSVNPSKKSDLHQRSGLGVSIAVATTSLRLQRRVLWLAISSRFFGPSQSVNSERQRRAPERYQNAQSVTIFGGGETTIALARGTNFPKNFTSALSRTIWRLVKHLRNIFPL